MKRALLFLKRHWIPLFSFFIEEKTVGYVFLTTVFLLFLRVFWAPENDAFQPKSVRIKNKNKSADFLKILVRFGLLFVSQKGVKTMVFGLKREGRIQNDKKTKNKIKKLDAFCFFICFKLDFFVITIGFLRFFRVFYRFRLVFSFFEKIVGFLRCILLFTFLMIKTLCADRFVQKTQRFVLFLLFLRKRKNAFLSL